MADNQRIDDLRRRIQADPASIAFAQLAEECRRAGLAEEAVRICQAGLALHPGYLSARVTLGRALLETHQLDGAERELSLVLQTATGNLSALRGLAEIHRRRGQTGEALAVYQRALLLAKNDPDLQQAVRSLTQELAAVPGPDRAPELRAESAPATPLLAAARAVAALEQFLAAIHVARAQPRA